MSLVCRVCLKNGAQENNYHPSCLKKLFDTKNVPAINLETSKLHTAALAMVGHSSLSGIQKKISVGLSADRATLQVAMAGGRYVLKPQTGTFPALPENEHVTTQLAELVGVEVAPHGLISLSDGTLAYIAKRFDRLSDGRKLHQEDFCQLSVLPPKDKYEGSAESCVKLLRKYAQEPLVEILKFYRLLVFCWWSGNGDMHLKNFSLFTERNGITRLTPSYDLVSTHLIIPHDPFAITIEGRKDKLDKKTWLRLARYCELPERLALRILSKQVSANTEAMEMIQRSFLPEDQKEAYKALVTSCSGIIAG